MFPVLSHSRFGTTMPESFDTVRREMDETFDRLFGRSENRPAYNTGLSQIPASLWEDDEHVYLSVDVPGLHQDDLDLTIQDGRLWIRGERKRPADHGKCWYDERTYGRFERVIGLSDLVDPDSIEAELDNGVLSVMLTKKPEAKPHRISINAKKNGKKRLSSDG